MFHCLRCSLSNPGVEINQELQFFSSFCSLVGAFPFTFAMDGLHITLHLKQESVEACSLMTNHRSLPGSLFPSSESSLGYSARCQWGRCQGCLPKYSTKTTVQSGVDCIPSRDIFRIYLLVGAESIPFELRSRRSQEIHRYR